MFREQKPDIRTPPHVTVARRHSTEWQAVAPDRQSSTTEENVSFRSDLRDASRCGTQASPQWAPLYRPGQLALCRTVAVTAGQEGLWCQQGTLMLRSGGMKPV